MILELEWHSPKPIFPFSINGKREADKKIILNAQSECVYPEADQSVEEIYWLSGFNQLPMEPFYMQLFECRRLLANGGKIHIFSIGGSGGAESKKLYDWLCLLRSKQFGFTPRPIHDYISPEDWREIEFKQLRQYGWIFEYWSAEKI